MTSSWENPPCSEDKVDIMRNVSKHVRHVLRIHSLQWRHHGRDGVSNHQPHHHLLNRLFRRRSKKASKLRVTGLCAGNSPVTGEFPAQMVSKISNAENVSIWWRHHGFKVCRWWSLEWKCHFDTQVFYIRCTGTYQNVNFRCRQCWKFRQNVHLFCYSFCS